MATERDTRALGRKITERRLLRDKVTQELNKLPDLVANADAKQYDQLQAQLETVRYLSDQIPALNTHVIDHYEEFSDSQTLEREVSDVIDFDTILTHALKVAETKLNECIRINRDDESRKSASLATALPQQFHPNPTKLPKLELKSFSGDPIMWQAFWDSFESKVHNNPTIPDIDKLHYLLKLLEGEAERAVTGYRPTANNYPVFVAVLKENFGKPETAKFKHFEALFALESAENDPSRLREVYSECEKHIRCLVALGLEEDTFGQVFVPLILSKLPKPTRLQLHRAHGPNEWDLGSLRDLLKQEIDARDLTDRFKGFNTRPPKGGTQDHNKPNEKPNQQKSNNDKFKQGKPWNTQGTVLNNSNRKPPKCAFCSSQHFSDECDKHTTPHARKAALGKACFKCLNPNHMSNECNREKPCWHCQDTRHHSSLCNNRKPPNQSETQHTQKGGNNNPVTNINTTNTISSVAIRAVLKMALVRFPKANRAVRMYFDDGSSTSYITTETAEALELPMSDYHYESVGRFGSTKRENKRFRFADLPIPLPDGTIFILPVHVTDSITSSVEKLPLDPTKYPILQHVPLADTLVQKPELVKIDVLVGGDYLHELLTGERIPIGDGLYLYGSKLGYIAAGRIAAESSSMEHAAVVLFAPSSSNERLQVEKFLALEDIGIKDCPYTNDDEQAQKLFDDTITSVDGRFQVGIPWRNSISEIPADYGLAVGRLKSLQRRLKDQPDVCEKYGAIFEQQLQSGIIERVQNVRSSDTAHYIPHHCVIKPTSATTKVRIVFDASAKSSRYAPSLNESVFKGPSNIQDLCGFLFRFRVPTIAMLSDIEKAYHQISIDPKDRDMMRFLWLRNPNEQITTNNLVVFRFCRVLFGMSCSQFLLDATIKHHLKLKGSEIAKAIAHDLYVDNIQGGSTDPQAALQFYKEVKSIFSEIGMNVREWYSNSSEFNTAIPAADVGALDPPKVLGLPWNTARDTIHCVSSPELRVGTTKREILSIVSSTFDPCGFFCPVVIRSKIFMQGLWEADLSWDFPISEKAVEKFTAIQEDVRHLSNIELPRLINPLISNPTARHELHCFVDASAMAYSAVVYIRSSLPCGKVATGLTFAKGRLAPMKKVTIPRLELTAAVIGSRIIEYVNTQMSTIINFDRKWLWSDSKCVLHWLQSKHQLKVFIQNRVNEIRKRSDISCRYVPTASNPADLPTKGTSVSELANNDLWWYGPSFLVLSEDMWPENIPDVTPPETTTELQGPAMTFMANPVQPPQNDISTIIKMDDFSSWRHLIRVTATVFVAARRFHKDHSAKTGNRPLLNPSLIRDAESTWIISVQKSPEGIQQIAKAEKTLRLVTDDSGIIRCKGPFEYADLDETAKAPIFLPRDTVAAKLIIMDGHARLSHAGVRQTLIQIRRKFWVPQGQRQVSKVVHSCTACRRVNGGAFRAPDFAPIPEFRVNPSLPFDGSGIDYFGPLLVKKDLDVTKVWVALFTCCVTRAVHLDIVTELSTEKFLLCFRRFSALYGKPSLIVSDNAKQFRAADKILHNAAGHWVSSDPIEWKFITEVSPWMGGFYERLVGTVKSALRKTLGCSRLNLEQLQTVLFEIAAIVNSRPLVASGDPEKEPGEIALTPAHFLFKFGRSGLPPLPAESDLDFIQGIKSTSQSLLEQWKSGQKLLDSYWKCWRNEYLASLRNRQESGFNQRNCSSMIPQVGTVVQVKDDGPRCNWHVGVITKIHIGQDGQCRSVELRLGSGKTLKRPVKLMYPIEQSFVEDVSRDEQRVAHQQAQKPESPTQRPNQRKAAVLAREKIQASFDEYEE